MSIAVSFIICVVWTLIAPEKDKNAWARYKNIEIEDGEQVRQSLMPGMQTCQPSAHCAPACEVQRGGGPLRANQGARCGLERSS